MTEYKFKFTSELEYEGQLIPTDFSFNMSPINRKLTLENLFKLLKTKNQRRTEWVIFAEAKTSAIKVEINQVVWLAPGNKQEQLKQLAYNMFGDLEEDLKIKFFELDEIYSL
jgi:hypothetical protein